MTKKPKPEKRGREKSEVVSWEAQRRKHAEELAKLPSMRELMAQAEAKRHDIGVFMIQATPAGESAACDAQWREVYKWWDKIAAWESHNG
jgi:hypothetical protein